jgi:hypothetical protein
MRMLRLALLLLANASCHATTTTTGPGSTGAASLAVHDDLGSPQGALAACATGDVAANLAIVSDLRESYHEMIVCGGLAMSFAGAIVGVIAHAALGRGGPSQLVYKGDGTYATPNGVMSIRASLTGGDAVGFDVLDPESYLAGLTIGPSANASMGARRGGGGAWSMLGRALGSLDVQFRGAGPGFQLLGLTAADAHSGHLSLDPAKLGDALASHLSVETRVAVDNSAGSTAIHYVLGGKPHPLSELIAQKALPMDLSSITATRAATGQTIHITEWTMKFQSDGTALDGTIAFDVEGGAFPYSVRFTYPHRKEPDITLSCKR